MMEWLENDPSLLLFNGSRIDEKLHLERLSEAKVSKNYVFAEIIDWFFMA